MLSPRLKGFLDAQEVSYATTPHRQAFTALEVAQSAHIRGREMAKTVIVEVDGRRAMAVLPATRHVDLDQLRRSLGARQVRITPEGAFRLDFPDCEVGAMPPFGNLFSMEVLVDPALAEDESIAFTAGSHSEVMRMAYRDFARLVRPTPVAM